MPKYTRFDDIPQFVTSGNWQCNFRIDEAVRWLEQERHEAGGVDLNPDFQRSHVWTEQQQIAWLEFLLRGGRTGRVLYFNHPGWQSSYKGTLTLVDGKQRLEAIRRFLNNEISVFGSYYKEFTDRLDTIDHAVQICINDLRTRREMIQWYIDLNAGGTPHTKAEIQKAQELLEKEP